MNRNLTLLGSVLALSIFALSYSTGPTSLVGDVTGSPVSTQSCSGCHNGGNFSPTTSIELLDGDTPINEYIPGAEYTLRVSVAATNNPFGFGFQVVLLDDANANAGTFGQAPDSTKITNRSNRRYLEHARRRRSPVLEIPWTAPETGTGNVTVYAAGMAFNNNGGNSGDAADVASLQLPEASSSIPNLFTSSEWTVVQQGGHLAIEVEQGLTTSAAYLISNTAGQTIASGKLQQESTLIPLVSNPGVLSVSLQNSTGAISTKRILWSNKG